MTAQARMPTSPRYSLPAFTDSTRLRLLLGTLLYLAQGFPQGIVYYAIPTWFAAAGQPIAVVGTAAAAASLPWTFKFLFGLLVDRYTWLPMGRRRPWLIAAQMGIILTMAGFAVLSPTADATSLIIAFSFLLSMLTAVQDVALDALAADLTPDGEKGRLNGYMFAGKLVGIAGGMGIMGYMLQYYGMREAMLSMLVCFTIPAAAVILIRERPGEKLLPWMPGTPSVQAAAVKAERWGDVFKSTLKNIFNRTTLTVIAIILIYGLHQAVSDNSQNLFMIRELGWSQAYVSSFSAVFNIIAAVFCLLAGGWIVDKFGPARVTLISALVATALLIAIAMFGDFFTSDTAYIAWYSALLLPSMLFYLSTLVLAMRVAESRVAATALAVIFGTQALGMTMGGMMLGPLEKLGGFSAMFIFSAVTIAVSGLFGLALGRKAGGIIDSESDTNALSRAHPEKFDLDGLT
jgi:PAT family beta-lactamase induction signal transducer AmpG